MKKDNIPCAEVAERINSNQLIPVISNSLCYEQVFACPASDCLEPDPYLGIPFRWTIENRISKAWADEIHYPLPDLHELARVAQYNYIRGDPIHDRLSANDNYLDFLKMYLIRWYAENRPGLDPDLIEELTRRAQEDTTTFSFLAQELGYKQVQRKEEDPLYVLARLPLPIYITTSYHDFIERELISAGKRPITQVCFWNAAAGQELSYNPGILDKCDVRSNEKRKIEEISSDSPWVYHLFGLERYPSTLVLSEDDFIGFLLKITQDNAEPNYNDSPEGSSRRDQKIPLNLYAAIKAKTLLLLGYRLPDWDLRILFRGIIQPHRLPDGGLNNFIIQLSPGEQYQISTAEQAGAYLQEYYNQSHFQVRWDKASSFLQELKCCFPNLFRR